MWWLIYIYVFVVSATVSAVLTLVARAVSVKLKIYDHPGERKLQDKPMPMLGGAAMLATYVLVTGVSLLALRAFDGAPFTSSFSGCSVGRSSFSLSGWWTTFGTWVPASSCWVRSWRGSCWSCRV
jgi:UDP-N-acetylmuramyl pentapeptide phosphotransferase/UDP-N-acetylglucosamine-1-phosphate transferase